MSESIAERLAAEIRQADEDMHQAVAVARGLQAYRDGLVQAKQQVDQLLAERDKLPSLPGLPLPSQAKGAPLGPLPPNVVDGRAQPWPQAPTDPDAGGAFRPVPDGEAHGGE